MSAQGYRGGIPRHYARAYQDRALDRSPWLGALLVALTLAAMLFTVLFAASMKG